MKYSRTFDDLEFVVRWEERTSEYLPAPLLFITKIHTRYEYERLTVKLREQVHAEPDYQADQIIATMTDADIRIEVRGWSEHDPEDPATLIRLLGVRKGPIGYTIRQLPAATPWYTDGYAVTECDAIQLAAELVAQLPEVDAGRLGEVALAPATATRTTDYSGGRSGVLDPAFSSARDVDIVGRAKRFLALPATNAGSISIVQGDSRFGPRGITRYKLDWRDLVDDGRYVITPQFAVAADATQMVKSINMGVAEVVQAIRDERGN